MTFLEEETQLLTQIGLTKTQAKVYLTLLRVEKANGKTVAENANVPRPEVYRVLDELRKKGLVEKEIAKPYRFRATPPELGLQILMNHKLQKYKEIQEKTNKFLLKIQNNHKETPLKPEYKLVMVEKKERIIQTIRRQHDNVQRFVYILSTLPRWLQILDDCYESYDKALERKVKYRVVLERPEHENGFPEHVEALLSKSNFELKFSRGPLETNSAIFDDAEATFNFFPSKSLGESPIIWTNHPSFLSMCKAQFKLIWGSTPKYHPKEVTKNP